MMAQEKGLDQRIDEAFQPVSDFFSNLIFGSFNDLVALISYRFGLSDFYNGYLNLISDSWYSQILGAPLVIIILVGSALFFTLYFGFPNFKIIPSTVVSDRYPHLILLRDLKTILSAILSNNINSLLLYYF